ncbi:MAG: hypothetical protein KDB22_27200 [Planctomycetales bacterium]|nr:hypothetical protein [Planctomycetales bacterium]
MKCPLYLHANGQWCKTIDGKKRYFGKDRDETLAKYEAFANPNPLESPLGTFA